MNLSTPFLIETQALSKTYKNTQALNTLDLKVHRNSIFGFLVPLGAGNTISIKLLHFQPGWFFKDISRQCKYHQY